MEYQDSLYSFININPETSMIPSSQSNEEFKSELVLNFSKNPLFEHLSLHIKSYLKAFSNSSKDKSKVSILSEFLNTNKFDNKILKQIIKNDFAKTFVLRDLDADFFLSLAYSAFFDSFTRKSIPQKDFLTRLLRGKSLSSGNDFLYS